MDLKFWQEFRRIGINLFVCCQMKIISRNVNGIRAVLQKGFLDFIKQEDTDDIQNGELKIFAFVDYKKWGFQIVPVYRLKDILYAGEGQEYKFETDEWICDFFDGEH